MTLADKIIDLRRKSGWSQEELAHRLNVSRQSVSKWEGAQSVPEVEKLLQMSRLFGVSTDYLLKDELERPEETGGPTPPPQPILSDEAPSDSRPLRRVSRELAEEYLDRRQRCAPRIALATFLCILSPIPLLLLTGMSQDTRFAITEEAAAEAELGHLDGGRCAVRCRDDGDAAAEPKKYPPRGFSQKARRSVTSGPLFVFRQLLFTS